MSYLFFTFAFIVFVVSQTTWMPDIQILKGMYDMTILLVVYLGFFGSARAGIPLIVAFGIVMDAVSGGPYGTYTTAYFWSYVLAVGLRQFVPTHNRIVFPLLIIAGVVIQNLVFIGTIGWLDPNASLPSGLLPSLAGQLLWAVLTGPLFLLLFRNVDTGLAKWQERIKNDYT